MGAVSSWFSKRFSITGEDVVKTFNESLPGHLKHWWFCLGGLPLFLFAIQIFTGILLALYYEPTSTQAYESVRYITEEVSYGWYIRNLHKWAATFMVATVILHQIRVFFTGAYRTPRELSWIIGMGLLGLTLMTGFTGYSLVYEQLSYWGVTVGANIANSVPYIGPIIKKMMLGGEAYNTHTLSRFFIFHAAILPAAICMLVFLHLIVVRIQGVTNLKFDNEALNKPKTFPLLPDHVYSEVILGTGLLVLLTFLATVFPAPLGPKADPMMTPAEIKPEWYFFTMYRWLKLFSATTALLSAGVVVLAMFLWPFIDGVIRRRTRFQEASIAIGIIVVLVIVGLTLWEAVAEH